VYNIEKRVLKKMGVIDEIISATKGGNIFFGACYGHEWRRKLSETSAMARDNGSGGSKNGGAQSAASKMQRESGMAPKAAK